MSPSPPREPGKIRTRFAMWRVADGLTVNGDGRDTEHLATAVTRVCRWSLGACNDETSARTVFSKIENGGEVD